MDSMIEIASFTVVGLVILFTISFATFVILKRKDNISDFFKSLGKDMESIDFSDLTVEGYEYYKSTYARRENKSALITPESAELILNFIPTYYENEKWLLRILRLIIDHRKRSENLDDSLLYYLYCNGFRTGYNDIDIEIDRQDFDSVDKCNKYISKYKRKIHTSDLPSEPTQLRKYYKLLGKKEGATVRGILFANEISKGSLRGYLQIDENLKNVLLAKIRDYFSIERTGKTVAIFIKAMWDNKYLSMGDSKESIYKALEVEIGYKLTPKADRSPINKFLNPYEVEKIEADAKILAERLKM
jgi:hypothetical protein